MRHISLSKNITSLQAKVLAETLSPSISEDKIVPAKIVEIENKAYLLKEGKLILIDNDVEFYKKMILPFQDNWKNLETNDIYNLKLNEIVKILPTIGIYITTFCNLNCPICYLKFYPNVLNNPRFHKTKEEIEQFLKSLPDHKLIIYGGGEVTLRNDLPEIIELTKKYNHFVSIVTNGIRLSNFEYTRRLKESGIDLVIFSLDGLDDRVLKELRGAKLLKYKLKALYNLKKLKIKTWIQAVIKKDLNENEIKKLLEFSSKNIDFIKGISFIPLEEKDPNKNKYTMSDIYKILSLQLNLPLEYFILEKNMRFKFYNILKDIFKNKTNLLPLIESIYFEVKKSTIEPYFSLDEVMKITQELEKIEKQKSRMVKVIKLIKITLSNPKLRKIGLVALFTGFVSRKFFFSKIKDIFLPNLLEVKVAPLGAPEKEDINRNIYPVQSIFLANGIITNLITPT